MPNKVAGFSPELFGERVRELRRACSYKSAKEFSDAIQQCTGVYIDHDSLIKIERGERVPQVHKFVAIAHTISCHIGIERKYLVDYLLCNDQVLPPMREGSLGDSMLLAAGIMQRASDAVKALMLPVAESIPPVYNWDWRPPIRRDKGAE